VALVAAGRPSVSERRFTRVVAEKVNTSLPGNISLMDLRPTYRLPDWSAGRRANTI
jgi:hypothetical protein